MHALTRLNYLTDQSTPVSTNFDVPANTETGAGSLEVVANGIPSVPVAVTVN